MRTGTKSLLFGVHQFAFHPYTVWRGWRRLYHKSPSWRECVCIVVHDWGYWGCDSMEGETEGLRHPELGARIAGLILGRAFGDLVLGHSRHYAQTRGKSPSILCWPDKLHLLYYPEWLYMLLSRASGELREYRRMAADAGFVSLEQSDHEWFVWVRAYLEKVAEERMVRYVFSKDEEGSVS